MFLFFDRIKINAFLFFLFYYHAQLNKQVYKLLEPNIGNQHAHKGDGDKIAREGTQWSQSDLAVSLSGSELREKNIEPIHRECESNDYIHVLGLDPFTLM